MSELVMKPVRHHSGERRPELCKFCRRFVHADEHTFDICERIIRSERTRAEESLAYWQAKLIDLEEHKEARERAESALQGSREEARHPA